MPNVKSAVKRMRTNKLREERNRSKRSRLRTALKSFKAAEAGEAAATSYAAAKSLVDRAAANGLIHANKAARLKSQLAAAAREKGVETL